MNHIRIKTLIMGLILGMMLSVVPLFAKDVSIEIDGAPLNTSQNPVTKDGVTLVPMRAIFEALGADVEWDPDGQSIMAIKDDQTIFLTLYGREAFSLDTIDFTTKHTTLLYPPISINNTTYVPLRFVGESLGADVKWVPEEGKITIISGVLIPETTNKTPEEILQESTDNISIASVYGGYFLDTPQKIIGPQLEHCIKKISWSNEIISDAEHIVSARGQYEGVPIVFNFSFNPQDSIFELIDVVKNGNTLSTGKSYQFLTILLKHPLQ